MSDPHEQSSNLPASRSYDRHAASRPHTHRSVSSTMMIASRGSMIASRTRVAFSSGFGRGARSKQRWKSRVRSWKSFGCRDAHKKPNHTKTKGCFFCALLFALRCLLLWSLFGSFASASFSCRTSAPAAAVVAASSSHRRLLLRSFFFSTPTCGGAWDRVVATRTVARCPSSRIPRHAWHLSRCGEIAAARARQSLVSWCRVVFVFRQGATGTPSSQRPSASHPGAMAPRSRGALTRPRSGILGSSLVVVLALLLSLTAAVSRVEYEERTSSPIREMPLEQPRSLGRSVADVAQCSTRACVPCL